MKICTTALSLVALALPLAASAQARTPAEYLAAIEGVQSTAGPNDLGSLTLSQLMTRFHVPGVSIAIIRDQQIHLAKGYGTADVESGAAVDTGTMFQAASMSKPVAAMGVMRAVQDRLFTLDDDINRILTSWQLDGGAFTKEQPVTPRMLTSHTSGLGDGFGFPGYDPAKPVPTVLQILNGHKDSNVGVLFMERPPMTLMEYSGGGVTLMQQALHDALKRPFADIMRDEVLRPIGMNHSTFVQPLPPALDRNAARAHSSEGKSMGAKWHVFPEQAAAGLWTTPSDLARFVMEVQRSSTGQSNRVLSRASVQEMLTPVGVGDYAVGFSIGKLGQGWYFSHGGANWGFRGTLLAHKTRGYGLVIMTNADQGGAVANELSRRIQLAYEWDSFAQPAPRGYRPPVVSPAATAANAQQEAVNAIFARYTVAGSPGCAVSVTRNGRALLQRGYGLADIEQNIPIAPQSAFYAASVSKQFTAAAIALLVARKQLSLDANVRNFVPEVPDYGTPITVRHLLHHTSGLRDYLSLLSPMSGAPEDAPLTEGDFRSMISRQRALNFTPGTRYSYSNTGYVLLSLIVRKVSGLSLREFTTKELFTPLGMTNTVFRDQRTSLIPRRATAYDTISGGFRTRVPGFDLVGDGGLFTTAADLAKWNPTLLDRALNVHGLSAMMLTRGRLASGDSLGYAMGLNVGSYRGLPTVRHGGSYGGYRAAYAAIPSANMSVALLCNLQSADPYLMANGIIDVYLSDLLAPVAPAAPPAAAALAPSTIASRASFEPRDLLGEYFSDELDVRWTIRAGASGGIALQRMNLAPRDLSLNTASPLRFAMDGTPLILRFERDKAGRVTGFVADAGEMTGIRFSRLR